MIKGARGRPGPGRGRPSRGFVAMQGGLSRCCSRSRCRLVSAPAAPPNRCTRRSRGPAKCSSRPARLDHRTGGIRWSWWSRGRTNCSIRNGRSARSGARIRPSSEARQPGPPRVSSGTRRRPCAGGRRVAPAKHFGSWRAAALVPPGRACHRAATRRHRPVPRPPRRLGSTIAPRKDGAAGGF